MEVKTHSLLKKSLLIVVGFYQSAVSPYIRGRCRFDPTCSEYCRESLTNFGVAKGLFLSIKRLSRCHPLGGNGFDPVPNGSLEQKK